MEYKFEENAFDITDSDGIIVITYNRPKSIINLSIIDNESVEICDLRVNSESDRSKGYGTLLLNYTCHYLKKMGYKCVVGHITRTDDHERRLKKFYTGRGFDVSSHKGNNFVYKITKELVP